MRVIAGKHRGRILKEFAGKEIRPTSDRAKESLFNILQPVVGNCVFLDLFCGTGSVGIEALSRGAKTVYFSDVRKESVALCLANLSAMKESQERVYCKDFRDMLSFLSKRGERCDVIFIDPPYALNAGEEALRLIHSYRLLKDGGVAIYENAGREPCSEMELVDRRKYGVAYFDFYKEKKDVE